MKQFFSQSSIGQRMGWAFGFVVISSLAVSLVSRSVLHGVSDTTQRLVDEHMAAISDIGRIKDNLGQVARSSRNLLLLDQASELQTERTTIAQALASNAQAYANLERRELDPRTRGLLKDIEASRQQFNDRVDAFLKQTDSNRESAKAELMQHLRPAQLTYMKAADALADSEMASMKQAAQAAAEQANWGSTLSISINLGTAVVAALLAWFITRSVTRPLNEAVAIAHAVAQGDLSRRIEVRSNDEIGRLLTALQTMSTTLQSLIGQLQNAADEIATGSGEIAKGNQDLSHRTEQQAANLQQTAASMEQLTSTVRHSTEASQEANQLASHASEVAARGAEMMQEVVHHMSDIATSSRKIGDIISVIDGIAFQTNILALNAAVEAARAGEQGRGFAVVAGEVRTLAQRSANAAKEIKALITASVEKVDSGSALVGSAGETIGDIDFQIKRVAELISDITATSIEQNGGIQQIHLAVTELDKVTQQNAALVEESAAAAESLKSQADQLTRSVQTFRL